MTRLARFVAPLLLVGGLAGGGVAYAATVRARADQPNLCAARSGSKVVYVVGSCPAGSRSIVSLFASLHQARGASDVTGPQGPAGPSGKQGTPGDTGSRGPAGPTGAIGAIGATGPQGPTGATGPKGPRGWPGFASDGATIVTVQKSLAPFQFADVEVSCPDWTYAASGGGNLTNQADESSLLYYFSGATEPGSSGWVADSYPLPNQYQSQLASNWVVGFQSDDIEPQEAIAYTICVR